MAIVAISCQPGEIDAITQALIDDPYAVTVEQTTGACDLLVTVWTAGIGQLPEYLMSRLANLPGVTATRTTLVTDVFKTGSDWRVGQLPPEAVKRLQREAIVARADGDGGLAADDHALVVALARDGRASYADLAEQIGVSVATARRRVAKIFRSGAITIRCDLARYLAGNPIPVTIWADVPPAQLAAVAAAVAKLSDVRLCAAVAGTQNLLITAWLSSLPDLQRLETSLCSRVPGLAIAERAIVLRHHKLMGRVLDDQGRSVRSVDMGFWGGPA
ncbi:Lrp/AsnC family transcriptional regulator [Metallococcus carri]|nr:Lrp/AsnC ligand binding domain-containing protein [Metallococcus carri]